MTQYPDTRQTLLKALRNEDTAAWWDFTAMYESVIYRVARKTGLQHADALDVAQEVLVKVHRAISGWDSERKDGRFRNWLHRLTVNSSIDVLRQRKAHILATGDSGVQESLEQYPASDENEAAFQLEYKRAVFNHVATLVRADTTDTAWQAFWMTSVEGLDSGSVAKKLGLSVGSVYAHKCRVLARIRRIVDKHARYSPFEGEDAP